MNPKPRHKCWMTIVKQILNLQAVFVFAVFLLTPVFGVAQENAAPIDFDRDIKPIFEKHCYVCHSEDGQETNDPDLKKKMETFDRKRVISGDSEASKLYESLITDDEDYQMPPPDNDYDVPELSASQIATVKRWIDEGALWSGEKPAETNAPPIKKKKDINQENIWWHLWNVIGVFHLAVVHFPIALLMVSAFFAIGGLRGSYVASDIAYYCLLLGALSAIASATMGWSYTMNIDASKAWDDWGNVFDTNNKFFLHGMGGIAVAVLSTSLAIYAAVSRRRDADASGGSLWKVGTFVIAGLVGWVGHEGGELVNKDLYTPVWEFVDRVQGKTDDDKNADKKDQPTDKSKTDQPTSSDKNDKTDPSKKGGGDNKKSDDDKSSENKSDDNKSDDNKTDKDKTDGEKNGGG